MTHEQRTLRKLESAAEMMGRPDIRTTISYVDDVTHAMEQASSKVDKVAFN